MEALRAKIGQHNVTCKILKKDRYQRFIVTCSITEKGERLSLNHWLTAEGYALAHKKYSKDYILAEEIAKFFQRGLWSGSFIFPWLWRQGAR